VLRWPHPPHTGYGIIHRTGAGHNFSLLSASVSRLDQTACTRRDWRVYGMPIAKCRA
jgi:hypothetical protein